MNETLKLRLAFGFCLAMVGAAYYRVPRPLPPEFALSAQNEGQQKPAAFFETRMLPSPGPDAPSAHAAALAELPDGKVIAAWFAGSREGAPDVAIYAAVQDKGQWSPAKPLVTRKGLQEDLGRTIRKLGNPVFHVDAQGRLHLYLVSVSIGGWAGSALNHSVSLDGGATWAPFKRLVTSPFFNISTLVRTPPLAMSDGGVGLPAYHEFLAKHGEWYRLDSEGRILAKARMPSKQKALQPAVVPFDGQKAVALMRDAGAGAGHVLVATTEDAGAHWQPSEALALGNPNASVALLKLTDGSLLLAANPVTGRNQLDLWLSEDQGKSWRLAHTLEQDENGEYSYPVLIQGADGRIHLAYTWQRLGIKYASFTEAWLKQSAKGGLK